MNNPMQLFQAMQNPQAFLQDMMQNPQAMQNPVLNNAMQMMQNGNGAGIEQLARNLCKERGIDPNQAIKQIKSQFRF